MRDRPPIPAFSRVGRASGVSSVCAACFAAFRGELALDVSPRVDRGACAVQSRPAMSKKLSSNSLWLAAAIATSAIASCAPRESPKSEPAVETAATGPIPIHAPDESTIPSGPLGDAIRRGKLLVTRTKEELPEHVGNGLHCTSCHLDGGTRPGAGPWVGLVGMFPEYRARNAKVNTLEQRVDDCFERSMNGKPLGAADPNMSAIVAYMTWLSRGVPVGREVQGRGFARIASPPRANVEHGKELYGTRCASCHGQDGGGVVAPGGGYVFPALSGERSFNIGAGMARLHTAAAFVKANMPLGQGGTLSDQDAYDVAAWFTALPRPDFARKSNDWPKGGKPDDARY